MAGWHAGTLARTAGELSEVGGGGLAGGEAGAVLGTALAIKMIAYIGVAPVVGAYANRLPRRSFLVAMDLLRAGVALSLPFVTEVWQIYILIFVLQST